MPAQDSDHIVRFAAFELDLETAELRRSGIRLPVQGRPLQVLAVLLRTPGQLVTSEQLRAELWPADTFVDFEHGVRNAVARLRAILGDAADRPRYIETLPRRGYRFIGAVAETGAVPAPVAVQPMTTSEHLVPATQSDDFPAPRRRRWTTALFALVSLIAVSGAGAGLYVRFRSHSANLQIKSLAVLPLENLSGDAAQEYFVDGVTDELITALAKMNSVKVISRTSVMQYKGVHNKLLPQIARELGVDAVIEGTLVRSGDRVRVTAQLIEATTDRHIWADRYERSSRDILLLENEISKAIAEQLRGKLDAHEERRFIGNPIDPTAHEFYLQGLSLWYRRTPHALEEAIRYFTQAIEKEPRYAEAYTGRALAYIVLGNGSMEAIGPEEAMLKGRGDAEKAVQLDETSSDAHAALAAIRNIHERDWRGMETEIQRAIELNPNNATARYWYGNYLCNVGRFEECLAETDRAHALDPGYLTIAVDVGCRLYEARRYDEAISPIQKVLEFNPDFAVGRLCLGQVYEANRRYPEAIAELRKALELSGGAAIYIAALGHAYAVSGQRAEALKQLQKLDELARRRYVSSFPRALIYAGLGEKDRALEWLERAFQERSSGMHKLKVDPRLDPLRGDARFTDLMRRVGLTP
jgi:TolB-like protein/DNA-binding winged helix-turn-helix (wHTH) protein/Tfp pilus assembly protein PilF